MRTGDGVRRGGAPEIECEERNGGGEGGYARLGTKTGGAEIPEDVTSVHCVDRQIDQTYDFHERWWTEQEKAEFEMQAKLL